MRANTNLNGRKKSTKGGPPRLPNALPGRRVVQKSSGQMPVVDGIIPIKPTGSV